MLGIDKKIDKVIELLWVAKDTLGKVSLTDEEFSQAIGNMKRAENLLWDMASEMCDDRDTN